MRSFKKYMVLACLIVACLGACQKLPPQITTVQQLCPYGNNVYVVHEDHDSALFWIPNCFAPGDSTSPNDSLVEYERNMAQLIVTLHDTDTTVLIYDNHTFQFPGFAQHTIWYGSYYGKPAPERCYLMTVTGTTLFGTSFQMQGTVSLLRYFFGKDSSGITTPIAVRCDSCFFNSQWNGSDFSGQLPTDEVFVPDKTHYCD
jgi:hypothetical protein